MSSQRLLENVRVVDLSQYIPGPFATRQLADLGADVIKIEPPGGDPMRYFMRGGDDGISPIYRHVNRGKRVCRLDLKADEGRGILTNLLSDADILLESYRPGVLARLGFDRDRLAQLNPELIHCALSGFGQNGPYAQRAGHDVNYCALAAQSIVNGTEEQPVIAYPPIADHASALQAAIVMLAALNAKTNGAGGAYLDISITESILAWQYLPALGNASGRAASILNGGAACYNIYQCADAGYISLGAIETVFWDRFCRTLGRPEWIDRQFESMPQHDLIAEVAAQIAVHPRAHWDRLLDQVDCCYAPLLEPVALAGNPQFAARGSYTDTGPGYPARVDGKSVDTASDYEQIESPQQLGWLTTD